MAIFRLIRRSPPASQRILVRGLEGEVAISGDRYLFAPALSQCR
jgi:hypothetical protein